MVEIHISCVCRNPFPEGQQAAGGCSGQWLLGALEPSLGSWGRTTITVTCEVVT